MAHYDRNKVDLSPQPSILAIEHTAPDHSRFGECFRVLLQWKSSVYQLAGREMLFFLLIYYILTMIRELFLDPEGKVIFDAIAIYPSRFASSIKLVILLGFFTKTALMRLFSIQTSMPGTSKMISFYINSLKPNIPEGPIIVEQFARWTVLTWILTFRMVSKPLRELYPDMTSLQRAGIINQKERDHLERVETETDKTPRQLLVIDWLFLLTKETIMYERFAEVKSHAKVVENILVFKKGCGNVIRFSKQNIPHAVIQASIILVYSFGFLTLMSRALFDGEKTRNTEGILQLFPLVPALQFFLFLSWLNFGRAAVNPFGKDESDIDVNSLVDTHIQDSLRLVRLYTSNLEKYFSDLPQREFNLIAAAKK